MDTTLRNWFLDLKLPQPVMANDMAMAAWERALSDPDHKGKVYAFWCLAGCDRYLGNFGGREGEERGP